MRELINTFSEMYVSSEGEQKIGDGDSEAEEEDDFFPPPPSPSDMKDEGGILPKDFVESFTQNLHHVGRAVGK